MIIPGQRKLRSSQWGPLQYLYWTSIKHQLHTNVAMYLCKPNQDQINCRSSSAMASGYHV